MVKETNRYATQQSNPSYYRKCRKWVDLDVSDVQKFIGLRIFMGYHYLPSFHDYWRDDPIDGGVTLPSLVMSRDKFFRIKAHLHFSDNMHPDAKTDRYWKIRPVINILDERFRTVYTPTQKVCIDESLFLYRGRHHAVQFIKTKRSRYGLKVFKLCESDGPITGYTSAFSVYLGGEGKKPTKKDQLISYTTVVQLLERAKLLDKNYILFTDNWYSSPTLFHDLQARKTAAIGTVSINRKHMPSLDVKKPGDVDYCTSPLGMLAMSWMDRRRVNLLTTIHKEPDMKDVKCQKPGEWTKKPQIVLDYNLGKTGVDVSDQMASYYQTRRKSVKWYQTLFWHLVDTAVVNAFLVWKILGGQDRVNAKQLQFRKDLIRVWFGMDSPNFISPLKRPFASRNCLLELIPDGKWRKCRWCTRHWKARKDTKYWCRQCEYPLCAGHCFNMYHAEQESSDPDDQL